MVVVLVNGARNLKRNMERHAGDGTCTPVGRCTSIADSITAGRVWSVRHLDRTSPDRIDTLATADLGEVAKRPLGETRQRGGGTDPRLREYRGIRIEANDEEDRIAGIAHQEEGEAS